MKKHLKLKLTGPSGNLDIETNGIYNEQTNEISYIEDNDLKTIVKFNFSDYTLTRKNKNMKLRYHFIENEFSDGEIELNDIKSKFILKIKTLKINIGYKKIYIEYLIEKEKFKLIIEVS